MIEYKIGDRIEAIVEHPENSHSILAGDTGTVCDLATYGGSDIGIAWDKQLLDGHDCGGTCEYGHGWYVYKKHIRLYEGEPMEDIEAASFLEIIFQPDSSA